MRAIHRFGLKLLAAGLLLPILSCASGDYDSGDQAGVVLQVQQIPLIPEIQTSFDATSSTCQFTVTNLSVSLKNAPKGTSAASPGSDIILDTVTLTYVWDNPALTTPSRSFAIGGTVPVGGTTTASFPPIAAGDLSPTRSGHTVTSLGMVFRGHTVAGDAVTAVGSGGSFNVKQCPSCQDTDGDGVCDSTDNCLNIDNVDQADSDGDSIGDLCDPCPQNPDPLCGP
jgi:hypothetical protein